MVNISIVMSIVWLQTKLPFLVTQFSDVHIEQRQKRRAAKGACAIEVRIVSCPTSHDLFIIHQTLTGGTARTTGHTYLESQTKLATILPATVILQHNRHSKTHFNSVVLHGLRKAGIRTRVWGLQSFHYCQRWT